jgi:hypothetical protein
MNVFPLNPLVTQVHTKKLVSRTIYIASKLNSTCLSNFRRTQCLRHSPIHLLQFFHLSFGSRQAYTHMASGPT